MLRFIQPRNYQLFQKDLVKGCSQRYQPVSSRRFMSSQKSRSGQSSPQLLNAISDLQQYNIRLKSFPVVTVVGPQSAGKSSVVEAICGRSLLPKGMKMATMKPMHLTTLRSQETKYKVGDRELKTEREARDEIARLNNNNHAKIVDVTVWSPEVYNSYLIDLPGLFVVSNGNQELLKKIKDINEEYVRYNTNIPLVIHSAPSDPATNSAIKLIQKHKREAESLGIITKVDMLANHKTEYLEDLLNGRQYPMGHGYCAVVLRNDKEVESGITIEDKMKKEKEFFDQNPQLKPSGVDMMRQLISNIQYQKIKDNIPDLIRDIDQQIDNLNASNHFLTTLVSNNPGQMASQLRLMIEKLVGSSLERAEFEDQLRLQLGQSIKTQMDARNSLEKSSVRKGDMGENVSPWTPVPTDQKIPLNILSHNSDARIHPDQFKQDTFKGLFNYGLMSATFIDNATLSTVYANESALGTCIPMFQFYIDDPQGKKRLQWYRHLNQYFSQLLKNDQILTIVHDITLKSLLEYIYSDPGCQDELTKQFAEYMVKEISNETYESKIKYSLIAMLNIEKRPQVSLFEISRYLFQYYPQHLQVKSRLFSYSPEQKLRIEVYGEAWNQAYLQVVADKMAENCYRNVAVNLLDRMVEKLLEMTMDMFNKDQALKEQNKVNEKIQKLVEIKKILSSSI